MSVVAEESVASPTVPNNTTSNILDDLGSLSLSSSTPVPPSQVASPPPPTGVMAPSPASGVMSPINQFSSPPITAQNNMNDLLGIFGGGGQGNGFGANVWSDAPQQNGAQAQVQAQPNKPKSNEDILGLF